MKKVCLISLPWQRLSGPSPALGVLAAFLKHNNRDIRVDCRHEHLGIAKQLGESHYRILTARGSIDRYSDMWCFPFLYPEKADSCVKQVRRLTTAAILERGLAEDDLRAEAIRQRAAMTPEAVARAYEILPERPIDPESATNLGELAELLMWLVMVRTDDCIDKLAREIADRYDLVGLTTSYNQLSTSLLLCNKLKRIAPEIVTVLGGILVNGRMGPGIIDEYGFIDFIIQGEGEYPLNALIEHLEEKDFQAIDRTDGILTRNNAALHRQGVKPWQVENLDELPFPDFDDYARLAGEEDWDLPVEGSRGCWWERCRFCNFNYQWWGYRTKSDRRFAAEVEYLCRRYGKTRFQALDNVLNPKGVQSFARALKDTDMDLLFFYEVRAEISPYELLVLYEAGLDVTQAGVEGLSRSILKEMRKGTKVIQNLQVMKTCKELGIKMRSNLIMDYPQSTREEVGETCLTIRLYAYAYDPLYPVHFVYYPGSPIDMDQKQNTMVNIRNNDLFRQAVPDEVLDRVELLLKSHDPVDEPVNWSPVAKAIEWWRKLQEKYAAAGQQPMRYYDCRTLLVIDYLRFGKECRLRLRDTERDLYLYCTKIRTRKKILEKFSTRTSAGKINDCLEKWTTECVMYKEGERFLSLAPAADPRHAARRIRRMAHEDGEIQKLSG